MSHWVGNYKVEELDTIYFFARKQMIQETESELIESSEMDSKTYNLAVTEEAEVDEAIPIYPKK